MIRGRMQELNPRSVLLQNTHAFYYGTLVSLFVLHGTKLWNFATWAAHPTIFILPLKFDLYIDSGLDSKQLSYLNI